MTTAPLKEESPEERQARLRPVLDKLREWTPGSVFLDLCELVMLVAEEVEGAVKWDHPRVVVEIRQRVTAERQAKRRGVDLAREHRADYAIPKRAPRPVAPPSPDPARLLTLLDRCREAVDWNQYDDAVQNQLGRDLDALLGEKQR